MPSPETICESQERLVNARGAEALPAEEIVRLACIDRALAANAQGYARAADLVAEARIFLDFVKSTNDAEMIGAAHKLAAKMARQ